MNYQEIRIENEAPPPVERCLRGLVSLGKFCLVLLVVPVVVAAYRQPLAEQNRQRDKLANMAQQRDALTAKRDQLLRQLEWIKTDPSYLEMRARDHEHMHQKGEYVIRFETH